MKTRVPAMPNDLLKIREAARRMGVSYPTLKQWIYKGKISCAKTPGGHYRIADAEVKRVMRGGALAVRSRRKKPQNLEAVSMRNKLLGTITEVQVEGLLAQIHLDIGGQIVTSIITRDACLELGLKVGMRAYAAMKSTEVSIIRA